MHLDAFKIGWLCALPTELAAATTMLDEQYTGVSQPSHDRNVYTLGRMADHDIVMTCLPAGVIGVASAARVAAQMRSSFPTLQTILMVGIGGGAPSEKHDIRLGDIVVSQPGKAHSGVIQYDYGRTVQKGRFILTGSLNRPPDSLLTAVANLHASYLYDPTYSHPENEQTCRHCLPEHLLLRTPRTDDQPVVHYGLIASANQVMRDGVTRDKLQRERDVLCFEMEAAGLMDDLPCLVVRGICDYADSHKNKLWQDYAAITAAAYVKELLRMVPLAPKTAVSRSTWPVTQEPERVHRNNSGSIDWEVDSQPLLPSSHYSDDETIMNAGPTYLDSTMRSIMYSAFKNFQQSVTIEEVRSFNNIHLADVRDVAIRIEMWHKQTGIRHYMRRIKPLLDALEAYSHVTPTSMFEPVVLSWIWSPIKLALEQARSFDPALDNLLNLYLEIACSLPNFNALKISQLNHRSYQILGFIYIDMLEMHHRIYKVLRGKAWKLSFDTRWTTLKEDFGTIEKNLKDLDAHLDIDNAPFDIRHWNLARKREREDYYHKEQQRQDFCVDASNSWLDIDGRDQKDHLVRLTDKRYRGTCDWVLDTPQYRVWCGISRASSVLWMSGIPGSGKSIICAHLINDLIPRAELTTLFYFCRQQGSKDSATCSHLLRSLIFQLVEKDLTLAISVWEEQVSHGHTTSIDRLRGLLVKLLAVCFPVRIVIDGLDECSNTEQKRIITHLQHLSQACPNQCRILLSSREGSYIPKSMRKNPAIVLRQHTDFVENDIASYIQDKLEQLREEWDTDVSVNTFNYLREKLLDRSKGMFLWVKLVIDDLHYKMDDKGVRNAMDRLPTTLQEAYDKIFQRMYDGPDSSLQKSINRCLSWMVYGSRALFVNEMLSAVGCGSLLPSEREPHVEPLRFLTFCKPLVEISKDGKVEFVHSSVREYLLNSSSKFYIAPGHGHLQLALACLLYINTTSVFLDQENRSLRMKQIVSHQRAIQQYASSNWLLHVCAYGDRSDSAPADSNLVKVLAQFHLLSKNSTHKVTKGWSPIITTSTPRDFEWIGDGEIARFLSNAQSYQADLERSESNAEDTSAIFKIRQSRDPTCLADIDAQFEADITDLLQMWQNSSESHEVDAATLDAFWTQDGGRHFQCRYRNCRHASNAFKSSLERDSHELTHISRIQCPILSCTWNGIGFKTSRELKIHTTTYHPTNSLDLLDFEILLGSFQQDQNINSIVQQSPQSAQHSLNESQIGLMDLQPIPPRLLRQLHNLLDAYGCSRNDVSLTKWLDLKRWPNLQLPEHHLRSLWDAQARHFHQQREQRRQPDAKYDEDSTHLDPLPLPCKLLEMFWNELPEICKVQGGRKWHARIHPGIANLSSIQRAETLDHVSNVLAVTFSLDGKHIATGSKGSAKVFELKSDLTLVLICEMDHYFHFERDRFVREVKLSSDVRYLATATDDRVIRVWEMGSTSAFIVNSLEPGTTSGHNMEFSRNGRIIVSVSTDRSVHLWDILNSSRFSEVRQDDEALAVTISPDNELIAAGTVEGKIYIWDALTGGLMFKSNDKYSHGGVVHGVSFTRDGRSLLSASFDKTCRVWELGDESDGKLDVRLGRTLHNPEDVFTDVHTTYDNKWAVTCGSDRRVILWDLVTGEPIMVISGHYEPVFRVVCSPTQDIFATVSMDGALNLWKYGILGNNQL